MEGIWPSGGDNRQAKSKESRTHATVNHRKGREKEEEKRRGLKSKAIIPSFAKSIYRAIVLLRAEMEGLKKYSPPRDFTNAGME